MTRIRRVRRPTVDKSQEPTKAQMDVLLQSIADAEDTIGALTKDINDYKVELYGAMKAAKQKEHRVGNVLAQVVTPVGNSSTFIDPQKYRKAVEDDKDFYSTISVSVTGARQVLSERALRKISVITPGKEGKETIKIKRVK